MKMKTHAGSRLFRRAMLLIGLVCLLAMVAQVGLAQSEGPAAVANGTLSVGKATTPAGGQDFWVTAASFQGSWGTRGTGPGQYRQPRDIQVDSAGNFYVSDHSGNRIQKLDPNGNFIRQIGSRGKGAGRIMRPNQIAVSGSLLLVTDTNNHRIAVFNTDGTFVENWGSQGSGNGQFQFPQGVVVDGAGNVFVADTWNHRIQVFTLDGTYVRQWGTSGIGQGQFRFPAHVDTDANGNLYVADSNAHRLQVFTNAGVFVRVIGGLGSGPGQFYLPVGIDVADGFLYVADTYNNRIQKLTPTGVYVGQWSQVANGKAISRPNGLVVVGNKVYAADLDATRIQIFSQTSFQLDDAQQLSASLPAGTYDVVEAAKAGWTLSSATCNAGSPVNITNGVRVTLADGATVACSFANSQ